MNTPYVRLVDIMSFFDDQVKTQGKYLLVELGKKAALSFPEHLIKMEWMKFIPVLLTFLIMTSSSVLAGSIQLGTGGLTPHFGDQKKNYCNQWNNTGIIANKSYYVRLGAGKYGLTYMRGNDSICSDIEGIFVHYLFTADKWWEMGMTVGGYSFVMDNWEEYGEKTPSGVAAPEPVHTKLGEKDIVPVLGLDVAIHLIRKDRWSLKLNNLFTPVIFNHSIALEYRF